MEYQNLEIKKLEKSRVEIIGEITKDYFESFRRKAVERLSNELSIEGFRKGKIPESVIISKVGEMGVLEEMAQFALSSVYPKIIEDNKLDPVGQPEIHITKIAKGNPLSFKITTSVIPSIKLPDYKKLAKQVGKADAKIDDITEKEIEDAILNIRRMKADHRGHDHSKLSKEEHDELVDRSLPELTDEFVRGLGEFTDVVDFKTKIKGAIFEEKKDKDREKRRIGIAQKIVSGSEIELPEIFVDSEQKRIEAQFSDDIAKMGVKMEDYLKHAKKTIEELRKEWRPHAEEKAKLQLVLNEIAKIEKLVPSQDDIEAEVEAIVKHYKDADREKATIYAETILSNEKVFQMLEE